MTVCNYYLDRLSLISQNVRQLSRLERHLCLYFLEFDNVSKVQVNESTENSGEAFPHFGRSVCLSVCRCLPFLIKSIPLSMANFCIPVGSSLVCVLFVLLWLMKTKNRWGAQSYQWYNASLVRIHLLKSPTGNNPTGWNSCFTYYAGCDWSKTFWESLTRHHA